MLEARVVQCIGVRQVTQLVRFAQLAKQVWHAGIDAGRPAAVRSRQQIIVAGATGAGKTTMLRALAAEIPATERIVTIETELELGLDRFADVHPDCVALEAREANVEGAGEVTAADLVRMSLRMNPDRVIVGARDRPPLSVVIGHDEEGTPVALATHSAQILAAFGSHVRLAPLWWIAGISWIPLLTMIALKLAPSDFPKPILYALRLTLATLGTLAVLLPGRFNQPGPSNPAPTPSP